MYSFKWNKEDIKAHYRYNTYIKGYKLFIVCSKENATDKQINEDIEATIKEVITYIENSF